MDVFGHRPLLTPTILTPSGHRRDWEAERARIAAAESEVARLLSEQQAEFAEREERLIQIR